MKLILENWNGYIDETKSRSACGDIYLFEENNIKKSSFYDSFNSLTESEDSIELFLENWERSIDYVFENLNEVSGGDISQAILQAETQAYMLLQRGKDKALKSVANTINKIKGALPKIEDPKKAKIAKYALGGLAAATIGAALSVYAQMGGDPSDFQAVIETGSDLVPEIAAQASEALQSADKESVGEIATKALENVSQASDQLSNVNDQTVQQMAKEMETANSAWQSELEDMFNAAEDVAPAGGPIELENIETPEDMKEWFNQAMEQAMEEEQAAREKKKAFDVRWDKETQKMQDYELEGELGMRPELSKAEIRDLRQYEKDFNNLMMNSEMPEIEGKSRQEIRGMLKGFDDEFYKKHFRKYIRQKNPRGAVKFIRKVLGK